MALRTKQAGDSRSVQKLDDLAPSKPENIERGPEFAETKQRVGKVGKVAMGGQEKSK